MTTRYKWALCLPVFLTWGVLAARALALVPHGIAQGEKALGSSRISSVPPERAFLDELSAVFESAANKVSPSVVPIFAEQVVQVESPFGSPGDPFRDFFGEDFLRRFYGMPRGDERQTVRSMGSGVIVSGDGTILTNNHVVEGAQKLIVVLEDKRKSLSTGGT